MKKHFITGVLLLAVTAGGFSTFTSCKDTDEDLYNQVNSKQVSLTEALKALQASLDGYVKQSDYNTKIQELENKINNNPHFTEAQIKQMISDALSEYATTASIQGIIDLFNGVNGQKSLADRLAALEEKKACDCTKDFTEDEVKALKELVAANGTIAGIQDQLKELFGEEGKKGTIATMQGDINTLNEILNGKDGADGLLQRVSNIEAILGADMTPEKFADLVAQGNWVKTNQQALEAIIALKDKLNGDALDALNGVYEDLAGIKTMYETIFKNAQLPEGATDWWNYGEVMQNIMDNSAAIADLQDDVDKILNRLNDMVTSLVLQASHNSVFGGFNTPFGINSMVLMTCYGERATQVNSFPASGRGAECYSTANDDIDWSTITSESYSVPELIVTRNADGKAALGNFWFTVNPGTVNTLDLDGFALVNSRDDDPVVELTNIEKDDETVLKFGVGTRAAGNGNGLYQAQAVVPVEDPSKIQVNIEPGLAQAIKDAVQNRTASDMATMLKKVYAQLQDICEANALRYTYEAATAKDANNNWIMTPQKVYSNYGIAATAFKPLSFATLKGSSFRHIPTFGSIEISKDMVDLDLGTFEVDGNNFSLKLNFGKPEFGTLDEIWVHTTVHAELDGEKDGETITVSGDIPVDINITDQAQDIQDNLTAAIDEWLGEGDNSLDARVEKSIWYALFNDPDAKDPKYPYDSTKPVGVVADLVGQVNSMMGNIQDKLDSLVDQINNDYLGKVNTLIDKYNAVAERVNNVLDDPNHYLQSVLLYKKAGKLAWNGGNPEVELPFGVLSTDPELPTIFKGSGEAISLWATTYSFETVAPAFKKIVGVVKVTDKNGNEKPELKQQANATLAKILSHNQYRVALNVKGAADGDRYEVAYQALDYTGHTSTVKCYIMIAR